VPRPPNLPPIVLWRRAVLAAHELRQAEKLVAFALAEHMNGEGRECWPSVARLAAMTAQDRRTVQRALRDLERNRWIQRAEGRGRGHSSRYAAAWPVEKAAAMPPIASEKRGRDAREKAAQRTREGGGGAARSREEEATEVVPPNPPRGATASGAKRNEEKGQRERLAALDRYAERSKAAAEARGAAEERGD
jgi:DNA-binding transcriptional MocR family regulator